LGVSGGARGKEARREHIIQAALHTFLAHGFNGATTDMIQAEAGVSKATLYRYFATKELMFAAAAESASRDFLEQIQDMASTKEDLRDFLTAFGQEFLRRLLHPRGLSLIRLMIMESQRFPQLGEHYYLSGPKITADHIERALLRAHARGEIHVEDATVAAEHFVSMVRGDIFLRRLLSVGERPPREELDRYVALTVDHFIRGFRRPGAEAG
jgi:AcrR family transcriptional regulator